ncbi:MAG: hypothetical protein WBX00_35710 [Isosphaeraceae bacterium]
MTLILSSCGQRWQSINDLLYYCTTGREQNQQYGDLTDLVMEGRGQAVVVIHNAMPADSTVAYLPPLRGPAAAVP